MLAPRFLKEPKKLGAFQDMPLHGRLEWALVGFFKSLSTVSSAKSLKK